MNRYQAVRTTMLESANAPFQFGEIDCCLFAAKVAHKVTGIDYSTLFDHTNETEAQAYIDEHGSIEKLITHTLGRDPVSVEELKMGDPVIVSLPIIGDTLGVFTVDQVLCKSPNGTLPVNINRIKNGWNLA